MAPQYRTLTDAARELGMSPRYLREICASESIGLLASPRVRLLTAADLKRVQSLRRPRGNPKFLRRKS